MSAAKAGPEVVEAEATIIEDELAPLAGAQRWLEAKREKVASEAAQYNAYEITSPDMHKQAKRERATLNGVAKDIDAERIGMTRSLNDALKQFKADADGVAKPITELVGQYDEQIKVYEERVIEARRAMLRDFYEGAAPDLAFPQESADSPLVPFERLCERYGQGQMGKKWFLFGTSDQAARNQIVAALDQIAMGEKTIDSMVAEDDREPVKAKFFSTLDINEAMADAMERKRERERLAALEAERRAREEEQRRIAEDARLAEERAEAERRAAETRAAREKAEADYAAGVRTGVMDMPGNNGTSSVTPEQMAAIDAVTNGASPQQVMAQPMPVPAPSPSVAVPGQPATATWVFAGYGNEMQANAFVEFCKQNGIGRHKEVPTNGRQYKLTIR